MKTRRKKRRYPVTNKKGRRPNPLRIDPTRTGLLRRKFAAGLKQRFARLRLAVYKLVVEEDAFGLKERGNPFTANYDPDQPRDESGKFTSGGSGGASAGGTAEPHATLHEKATTLATAAIGRSMAMYEQVTAQPVLKQVRQASDFCKDVTKKLYAKLEGRYGKAQAIAIMAAGQAVGWGTLAAGASVGVPLYLPGSTIWGSLPAAALAEGYLQAKRGVAKVRALTRNAEEELSEEEIRRLGEQTARELEEEFLKWLAEHESEIREAEGLGVNVFCPTGPGGGRDPSCSPGGDDVLDLGEFLDEPTPKAEPSRPRAAVVRELSAYGPQSSDPDPRNTRAFNLGPHKKTAAAIEQTVVQHGRENKYTRLTISDIAAQHPGIPIGTLHGILGKMQHEGRLRLGPYTQAVSTHARPEHLLPLDRERKYYLEPGDKLTGNVFCPTGPGGGGGSKLFAGSENWFWQHWGRISCWRYGCQVVTFEGWQQEPGRENLQRIIGYRRNCGRARRRRRDTHSLLSQHHQC